MRPARPQPPSHRAAWPHVRWGARAAARRPAASRTRRSRQAVAAPAVALLVGFAAVLPGPAAAAATWTRNLYVTSALVYQDPYYTACVAASTMTMLNTIAARGTGGPGFTWSPYRVKNNTADATDTRDMVSILAFARARDTLRSTSAGSDAHGWRNALNYYGWGEAAMTDPSRMVYADRAYATFTRAVKAAVRAIARFGMPVGILGWAGGHAQVMTGYIVTGADPRFSNDFDVRYVYLSDPLRKDWIVNKRISMEHFRSGALKYRFQRYRETDSPYDDPYATDVIRSAVSPRTAPSEWYHRWVIVLPVRSGLAAPVDPAPTDSPAPGSSEDADAPQPDASAATADTTPAPAMAETSSSPPSPDPVPPPDPTAEPAADAAVTPSLEPAADAAVTPSPDRTPDPASELPSASDGPG